MRLLLDFGAIKTGGGVQLATNFLNRLKGCVGSFDKIYLLVPDSGPLSKIALSDLCDDFSYYPNNYLKRKVFELTELKAFLRKNKIDMIYTFFGAGLPRFCGVKAVVSVAYPIICYPDSAYWQYVAFMVGWKKRVVNILRRKRIRAADIVVVETDVMARRIARYAKVKPSRIRVIPPSPSLFIVDKPFSVSQCEAFRILLLSGVDSHKNLWRLPAIAYQLNTLGVENLKFVLSVDKEVFINSLPKKFTYDEIALDSYFEFVGAIAADQIERVYQDSDFLLNLSDLESFSNNYMEAWKSGLPLICSDTDFARNICGGSAVYINPHDPCEAASKIKKIIEDRDRQADLVSCGKQRLLTLPNAQQKFELITSVLQEVAD